MKEHTKAVAASITAFWSHIRYFSSRQFESYCPIAEIHKCKKINKIIFFAKRISSYGLSSTSCSSSATQFGTCPFPSKQNPLHQQWLSLNQKHDLDLLLKYLFLGFSLLNQCPLPPPDTHTNTSNFKFPQRCYHKSEEQQLVNSAAFLCLLEMLQNK